jgi:hypothetical protein
MKRILGGLLAGAFLLLDPGIATHVHPDDGPAPVESDCVACVFSQASAAHTTPPEPPTPSHATIDVSLFAIPTAPSIPHARQAGSRDPPHDA